MSDIYKSASASSNLFQYNYNIIMVAQELKDRYEKRGFLGLTEDEIIELFNINSDPLQFNYVINALSGLAQAQEHLKKKENLYRPRHTSLWNRYPQYQQQYHDLNSK